MVKSFQKYFDKLPKNQRQRLTPVLLKIMVLDLDGLDVKPYESEEGIYRVRVGKFRILFLKNGMVGEIVDINTRGDIY